MNIYVFGINGQLGKELSRRNSDSCVVAGSDLPDVDVTAPKQVNDVLLSVKPGLVINAAAYTAVDKAEEEKEIALKVNRDGAENIASVCSDFNIPLFHLSTDYVFGQSKERTTPYTEEDSPSPINYYGETKLAGEKAVLDRHPENSLIIRTSSVHGAYGHNFVKTMVRLMKERDELSVVDDQIMSPTWAGWLAEVLLQLAVKTSVSSQNVTGYLNASNSGAISWFDFAEEIKKQAFTELGREAAVLKAIPTEQYSTPAKRPKYSALDCAKLEKLIPEAQLSWSSGLQKHLTQIL